MNTTHFKARTVFISSYNDTITTANLQTTSSSSDKGPTTYELTKTHTSHASKPNPAWLSQLPSRNLLVILNEGLDAPEGSVSVFKTNFPSSYPNHETADQTAPAAGSGHGDRGGLKHVETTSTLSGPVSSCFYARDNAMAAAHYSGSGVTTWRVLPAAAAPETESTSGTAYHLEHLQTLTFPSFPQPGPVEDRQEAPHPHQVLLDHSGKFLLVPDLGADLVRVFSWNDGVEHSSLRIEECGEPLKVRPGTGPRHGVFWSPSRYIGGRNADAHATSNDGEVYFYLVGELDSSLTAYRVIYRDRPLDTSDGRMGAERMRMGLGFEEIFKTWTFGSHPVPKGNAAAEIAVCPDNKTLIVSNRNTLTSSPSTHEQKPSSDPQYPIDNLALFNIFDHGSDSPSHSTNVALTSSHENNSGSAEAKLSFSHLINAGGRFPRHFSIDPSGMLAAVGSQLDQRVIILRLEDGEEIARLDVGGDVTCVIWAEQ